MTKKLLPIKLMQVARSLILNINGEKHNFTTADKDLREKVKKAVETYNKAPNEQRLDKVIKLITPKTQKKELALVKTKSLEKKKVKVAKAELKEATKELKDAYNGINFEKPDPAILGQFVPDARFKIISGRLFLLPFINVALPPLLVTEIVYYQQKQLDLDPLVNFWKLALLNPNPIARTKLFDYLSRQKLLITSKGYFVTYRMVKTTSEAGVYTDAHTHTMRYVPKSVCRIPREQCDEDGSRDCSRGLHTGTPLFIGLELGDGYKRVTTKQANPGSYGTGYDAPKQQDFSQAFGNQAIRCLVNPMHVVSVPDSDTRKMRSCEFYFCGTTTAEEVMKEQLGEYTAYEDLYHEFEAKELDEMLKNHEIKQAIDENKVAKGKQAKEKAQEKLNQLKEKVHVGKDPVSKELTLEEINLIIQSRLK